MTPDKFLAVFGIGMALIVAFGNGVLPRLKFRSHLEMSGIYAGMILLAALCFAGGSLAVMLLYLT